MTRPRRATAVLLLAAVLPLTAACGGDDSPQDSPSDSSASASASSSAGSSSPDAPDDDGNQPAPDGPATLAFGTTTTEFDLESCSSQAEDDIVGAGSSDSYEVQLTMPAGGEGTMIVSDRTQGNALIYEGVPTGVSVSEDGSFTASGTGTLEPSGEPADFTVSGTCDVQW